MESLGCLTRDIRPQKRGPIKKGQDCELCHPRLTPMKVADRIMMFELLGE